MDRIDVTITVDGACSGNPGPGGYAAILRFGDYSKEIAGYDEMSTNNRMELQGVIEAVKLLKRPCNVTVRTDSMYVCQGIARAKEYLKTNWHTKSGARCINYDQWMQLTELGKTGHHHFQYLHVDGHSGDPDNERCDKLAKQQIKDNRR